MARHVWTVVCRSSTIDKEDNNISLFHVLEQLSVQLNADVRDSVIPIPMPIHVVSLWSRSDRSVAETADVRVRIIAPDGDVLAIHEQQVDLVSAERSRLRLISDAIPVKGAGVMDFEISCRDAGSSDWRVWAAVPLSVKIDLQEGTS